MNKLHKGGLAFIVKCPPQPLNIGVIVELVKKAHGMWLCAGNVKPAPGCSPLPDEVPYRLTFVPPEYLKPCDDPGDDARDESFRWAPAPEKVLA